MDHLNYAHFFALPSQGNTYTMTDLHVANCPCKLLVATLKREIFCIEYQDAATTGYLMPTTKEVSFTYIPSGAEIISMDAFNKSQTKNEFVIGITIIKNSNNLDSLETYLNIYSEWEESDDFNIENIAQNCLNVELNFVPYMLTHVDLVLWGDDDQIVSKEVVFILSGSDNLIHIYREYAADHLYKEIDNKEHFPEFTKTSSPVVWIDIYYTDDYSERITAFACESGYVRLTKVCVKTNTLSYNFSTKFNNYVSNIQIYTDDANNNILNEIRQTVPLQHSSKSSPKLNLVVINTILPPVVFEDVLTYGLSNYSCLPRFDCTSVLSCCQVIDIDFDGIKEILIGNSAEELVVCKYNVDKGCWCLEEMKRFGSPLMGLRYVDVTGDGINELIVLSMKGVHFLQHDFGYVQKVLAEKVKRCLTTNS